MSVRRKAAAAAKPVPLVLSRSADSLELAVVYVPTCMGQMNLKSHDQLFADPLTHLSRLSQQLWPPLVCSVAQERRRRSEM